MCTSDFINYYSSKLDREVGLENEQNEAASVQIGYSYKAAKHSSHSAPYLGN